MGVLRSIAIGTGCENRCSDGTAVSIKLNAGVFDPMLKTNFAMRVCDCFTRTPHLGEDRSGNITIAFPNGTFIFDSMHRVVSAKISINPGLGFITNPLFFPGAAAGKFPAAISFCTGRNAPIHLAVVIIREGG